MPTRRVVAEALMRTLERETAGAFQRRGLGLTVEVAEIDGTASQDQQPARADRDEGARRVNRPLDPKLASNLDRAATAMARFSDGMPGSQQGPGARK